MLHARRYLAERRPDASAPAAGDRRSRRVRPPVPEPAVGAAARPRRLAGAVRRRRRRAGAARGRGAVGEPRSPAADQGDVCRWPDETGRRFRSVEHRPAGGADPVGRRAGGQRRGAVVDRSTTSRRRLDHLHRPGPRGLAVAGARRIRPQRSGRGGGRTPAGRRADDRTDRRRRAAGIASNSCGGWRSATGCDAGGRPASATASPPSTARCSTPRSRC